MNQITLLGRVGQDPQIKNFENGGTVAQFTIATDDSYKDKDGNKVERTDWHNIRVTGALTKVVEKYVLKGKRVMVQGKSKTRKYNDKDGNERYVTEVHVINMEIIDWPEKAGQYSNEEPPKRKEAEAQRKAETAPQPYDDDLPF